MNTTCSCEGYGLEGEGAMHTVTFEPNLVMPFGIMYAELHTVRWCIMVNSQGGMLRLAYAE